jgi:hypothetical protein
VPSTLTVTNTLDTGFAGDGSLPGEIAAAQSGDTIVFDPTTMTGKQIVLTSGDELFIDKNLTIQGLPAGSVISGAGSRVFDVRAGVSVTLANLTITGGNGRQSSTSFDDITAGEGGGILNSGTLTVQNCTVTGNTDLIGSPDGGGIYNAMGAALTVTGSTVSGNGNVLGPDHTGAGGGIYNAGMLTINGGSDVSGNVAFNGGGIFNAVGGNLSMTATKLSGNSADSSGGGLYNTDRATAAVTNCTITGNTAGYEGGGIYSAKYGHVTVGGSVFSADTPDNIFGSYTDKKGNTFH